jgi:GTP cyclohydrolase II/3,4-dihydroxy 2-butanone 4-phosphate synthase/GTP cyclohydrolase II
VNVAGGGKFPATSCDGRRWRIAFTRPISSPHIRASVPLEKSMPSNAVKSIDLDIDWSAQTVLPIEFRGRELQLEARAYQGADPTCQALVLVHRDKDAGRVVPVVRVHSGCVTGDIFHSLRCDCYPQLQAAIDRIATSPVGVLVYLPYHEGRGIGLVNKIRAYALQDLGYDTVDANVAIGAPIEARDYDLAAYILFDLGCSRIRLLTNNPTKVEALKAEGIDVVEQLPLIVKPSNHNTRYLKTKKERMAHKL